MSASFALGSTMTRLRGVNYRVEFGPPPLPGWVLRTQQVMWSDSHPLKHYRIRFVNNLARFKSSIGKISCGRDAGIRRGAVASGALETPTTRAPIRRCRSGGPGQAVAARADSSPEPLPKYCYFIDLSR